MHCHVFFSLAALFVAAAQGQFSAVTSDPGVVNILIESISGSVPGVVAATATVENASNTVNLEVTVTILATNLATATLSDATGPELPVGSASDLDRSSAVSTGVFASTTISSFFTPTGVSVTITDSASATITSTTSDVVLSTITTEDSKQSSTSTTMLTKSSLSSSSNSIAGKSTSTSTGGAVATEMATKCAALAVVAGFAMVVL